MNVWHALLPMLTISWLLASALGPRLASDQDSPGMDEKNGLLREQVVWFPTEGAKGLPYPRNFALPYWQSFLLCPAGPWHLKMQGWWEPLAQLKPGTLNCLAPQRAAKQGSLEPRGAPPQPVKCKAAPAALLSSTQILKTLVHWCMGRGFLIPGLKPLVWQPPDKGRLTPPNQNLQTCAPGSLHWQSRNWDLIPKIPTFMPPVLHVWHGRRQNHWEWGSEPIVPLNECLPSCRVVCSTQLESVSPTLPIQTF